MWQISISVNISGKFDDCTGNNPCSEDEGDCDNHEQCKENLKCGTDNCRSSLGFDSFYDCCYSLEEDGCTVENPCTKNQGDCDSHEECQNGLACGLNNWPNPLGLDPDIDCCYQPTVGHEDFCSSGSPCGLNEGDCNSNNECETNLICNLKEQRSCTLETDFKDSVQCCVYPSMSSNILLSFSLCQTLSQLNPS